MLRLIKACCLKKALGTRPCSKWKIPGKAPLSDSPPWICLRHLQDVLCRFNLCPVSGNGLHGSGNSFRTGTLIFLRKVNLWNTSEWLLLKLRWNKILKAQKSWSKTQEQTKQTITCSKSSIEILEKGVKYVLS